MNSSMNVKNESSKITIIWVRLGSYSRVGGGFMRRLSIAQLLRDIFEIDSYYVSTKYSYHNVIRIRKDNILKPLIIIDSDINENAESIMLLKSFVLLFKALINRKFLEYMSMKFSPYNKIIVISASHTLFDLIASILLWISLSKKLGRKRIKLLCEVGTPLIYYNKTRIKGLNFVKRIYYFINDTVFLLISGIFNVIIVVDYHTRDVLRKLLKRRNIITIPNAATLTQTLSLDLKKYISKASKKVTKDIDLIYYGRLSKEKGFNDLIRIVSRLFLKSTKQRKVLIIGTVKDPKQKHVLNLCKKLGKLRNHELLYINRFIPKKELIEYLKHSKIFILPSYVDTFSISTLEALTLRTLVVAYDNPSLHSIYNNLIYYVRPGDIDEAVNTILNILSNYEKWSKTAYTVCLLARKLSNLITWHKIATLYYKILRDI